MNAAVGSLSVGQLFEYEDTTFVRTPQMSIKIEGVEFVTNCLRKLGGRDDRLPVMIIADFVPHDQIVELTVM